MYSHGLGFTSIPARLRSGNSRSGRDVSLAVRDDCVSLHFIHSKTQNYYSNTIHGHLNIYSKCRYGECSSF